MNLGRAPLLIEGLPAQHAADPRAVTQSAHQPIGRASDIKEPPVTRGRRNPTPHGVGLSSGNWGSEEQPQKAQQSFSIPLSKSTIQAVKARGGSEPQPQPKTFIAKRNVPRRASDSALYKKPADPRFPSPVHREIHELPAHEAISRLKQIWDKRHETSSDTEKELDYSKPDPDYYDRPSETGRTVSTGQKNRLPPTIPGAHHPDPQVRAVAAKMQAHTLANSLGNTWDRKAGEKPIRAQAHVIRNTQTGGLSTVGQFHGKPMSPIPKGHEVVYTAISEGLERSPLLAENLQSKVPQPRRDPPLASDERLRARIAGASGEAAARLRRSLEFREKLRATRHWPMPEPSSGATTAPPSPVQQAARRTRQSDYPGEKTNTMRPPGHKTQVVLDPAKRETDRRPSETAVMPPIQPASISTKTPRPDKTQALRVPKTLASSVLIRAPLLQELVANTFLSKFPAGTRVSGAPGASGVTDTSNVGLVSAQGGIVPDKKKREIKIPKPEKLPPGRDPLTRQLEKQPAFIGGVLTRVKSRTEDVLDEASLSAGFLGRTQSITGPNMDLPQDDHVAAYRQFRSECPLQWQAGHASFCNRCDNSWPSAVGGANIIRPEDITKLNPYGMNPFESHPAPIQPIETSRPPHNFGPK